MAGGGGGGGGVKVPKEPDTCSVTAINNVVLATMGHVFLLQQLSRATRGTHTTRHRVNRSLALLARLPSYLPANATYSCLFSKPLL